MNARTYAIAVGVGAPLILAGSIHAGFTGISAVSKPNPFGLSVVNLYAEFDRPGEDLMLAVAGTQGNPLFIEVVGGTFYQHPVGTDRPPNAQLVDVFPSLAFDTFVSIGVASAGIGGQPEDWMVLGAGWPGFGASTLHFTNNLWVVTPDNAQADPFNADFVAGDGRVLIGQFSTEVGTAVEGTMLLAYFSNGIEQQQIVNFKFSFCPWDCGDGDGVVGIVDFLIVLAQWGEVGSSCDFSGDSVGIDDFLELLANWGPCP